GGPTATLAGPITNHASLIFNRSNDLNCGGDISGTGTLTKTGGGVLTLTGDNTYSGGTTIAGGTLSLGSNTAAGTGAITTTGSVIEYGDGASLANPIILNSNDTQLQVLTGSAAQSGGISEPGGSRPLEKFGPGAL